MTARRTAPRRRSPSGGATHVIRLYTAGVTRHSTMAVRNVKAICDEHLAGRYDLTVIDLYQQPNLARELQVIAAPTLIRLLPEPVRRLIGDMSDIGKVLLFLDIAPAGEES